MRIVKANENFYGNKVALEAEGQIEQLSSALEGVIAEWLWRTGIWDTDITIVMRPFEQIEGHFEVSALVKAEAKPLRGEAGGVPALRELQRQHNETEKVASST